MLHRLKCLAWPADTHAQTVFRKQSQNMSKHWKPTVENIDYPNGGGVDSVEAIHCSGGVGVNDRNNTSIDCIVDFECIA